MKLAIFLLALASGIWIGRSIGRKIVERLNRPSHDTETDGRIDDSGYGDVETERRTE